MLLEQVDFREVVELFLYIVFAEIKNEREVPNLNFKFGEDGYAFFEDIVRNPFVKEGFWTPNAEKKNIDFMRSRNADEDALLTLEIDDSIKFFQYLTDITNETIKLNADYHITLSAREMAQHVLQRIWLRMSIEDVSDIFAFFDRQLQFVKNRTFDNINVEKIGTFDGYDIFKDCHSNATWAETSRTLIFTLSKDDNSYRLPQILYDIDDDGVCYIYAVQKSQGEKDKKIERALYKLNKNIDNPNVHPSKVCAMLLFISELKKKGISKIRIPSMQVLSYRYHEIISEKAKEDLEASRKKLIRYPEDNYLQEKYAYAQEWYAATYEKQDKISYLKTEELINLVYRILEHEPDIEIVNEVNVQGDYLSVRIK